MPTKETEAKFLDVDFAKIREKLGVVGAKQLRPMTQLRRAILETPAMRAVGAFARVRDEGDGTITLTYKQHAKLELGGATEISLVVDDFQKAIEIAEEFGLTYKSYQESRREIWQLGDTMIMLDEWPWLNSFVEVEAETAEAVKMAADRLGFDWQDAIFGGIMIAYQHQYPDMAANASVIDLPKVQFDDPIPAMFYSNSTK